MLVFEQHPRTGDFQLRDYESGEVVTSFIEESIELTSEEQGRAKLPEAMWRRFDGRSRRFNFQTGEVEDVDSF